MNEEHTGTTAMDAARSLADVHDWQVRSRSEDTYFAFANGVNGDGSVHAIVVAHDGTRYIAREDRR